MHVRVQVLDNVIELLNVIIYRRTDFIVHRIHLTMSSYTFGVEKNNNNNRYKLA